MGEISVSYSYSGTVRKTLLDQVVTFLVCSVDTFSHLFFAVGIHIHIWKDSGLVRP